MHAVRAPGATRRTASAASATCSTSLAAGWRSGSAWAGRWSTSVTCRPTRAPISARGTASSPAPNTASRRSGVSPSIMTCTACPPTGYGLTSTRSEPSSDRASRSTAASRPASPREPRGAPSPVTSRRAPRGAGQRPLPGSTTVASTDGWPRTEGSRQARKDGRCPSSTGASRMSTTPWQPLPEPISTSAGPVVSKRCTEVRPLSIARRARSSRSKHPPEIIPTRSPPTPNSMRAHGAAVTRTVDLHDGGHGAGPTVPLQGPQVVEQPLAFGHVVLLPLCAGGVQQRVDQHPGDRTRTARWGASRAPGGDGRGDGSSRAAASRAQAVRS